MSKEQNQRNKSPSLESDRRFQNIAAQPETPQSLAATEARERTMTGRNISEAVIANMELSNSQKTVGSVNNLPSPSNFNVNSTSPADLSKEIMKSIDSVRMIIKVDDWYNIPEAVRATCEGIVQHIEKLSNQMIKINESHNKKSGTVESSLRKDIAQNKAHLDRMDQKFTRDFKKINQNMENFVRESKNKISGIEDNFVVLSSKLTTHGEVQDKLQERVGTLVGILLEKIKKVDIHDEKLTILNAQIDQLFDMFIIPPIIGPDSKKFSNLSVGQWIKDVDDFKENLFLSILENKVKGLRQTMMTEIKKVDTSQMHLINQQQIEVSQLREQMGQLETDVKNLGSSSSDSSSEEEEVKQVGESPESEVTNSKQTKQSDEKEPDSNEIESERNAKESGRNTKESERNEKESRRNEIDSAKNAEEPEGNESEPDYVGKQTSLALSNKNPGNHSDLKNFGQDSQNQFTEPRRKRDHSDLQKESRKSNLDQSEPKDKLISRKATTTLKLSSKASSKKNSKITTSKKTPDLPQPLQIQDGHDPTAVAKGGESNRSGLNGTEYLNDDESNKNQRDSEMQNALSVLGNKFYQTMPSKSKLTNEENPDEKRKSSKEKSSKTRKSKTRKSQLTADPTTEEQQSKHKSKKRKQRSSIKDKDDSKMTSLKKTLQSQQSNEESIQPSAFDQNQIKRIDELIRHQMRNEAKVDERFKGLMKMLMEFSRAMFERQNDMMVQLSPQNKQFEGSNSSVGGFMAANYSNHNVAGKGYQRAAIGVGLKPKNESRDVNPSSRNVGTGVYNEKNNPKLPSISPLNATHSSHLHQHEDVQIQRKMLRSKSGSRDINEAQLNSSSNIKIFGQNLQKLTNPIRNPSAKMQNDKSSSYHKNSNHMMMAQRIDTEPFIQGTSDSESQIDRQYQQIAHDEEQNMYVKQQREQFFNRKPLGKMLLGQILEGVPAQAEQTDDEKNAEGIFYSPQISKRQHFLEFYFGQARDEDRLSPMFTQPPERSPTLRNLLSNRFKPTEGRDTLELESSEMASLKHIDQSSLTNQQVPKSQRGSLGDESKILATRLSGRVTGQAAQGINAESSLEEMRILAQQFGETRRQNSTVNSVHSGRSNTNYLNSNNSKKIGSRGGDSLFVASNHPNQEEWVEVIRCELTEHIEILFRKKMQEFIEFIEEYVNVEDQINPNNDNVIHAFYREHNTLQKMHENFRLLEYKRKKYLEKKKGSGSKSPPRQWSNEREKYTNAQRNFLTSLYGVDSTAKHQQQQIINQNLGSERGEKESHNRTADTGTLNFNSGCELCTSVNHSQKTAFTNVRPRQTSQPMIDPQPRNARLNMPQHDLNSSGITERRRASVYHDSSAATKQNLPIISKRKVHLTIDQRVWDSNQIKTRDQTPQNNSYEKSLVKQGLAQNSSENFMANSSNIRTQEGPRLQEFQLQGLGIEYLSPMMNKGLIPRPSISTQVGDRFDYSQPALHSMAGSQVKTPKMSNQDSRGGRYKGDRAPSLPLSVQFQDFKALKNI